MKSMNNDQRNIVITRIAGIEDMINDKNSSAVIFTFFNIILLVMLIFFVFHLDTGKVGITGKTIICGTYFFLFCLCSFAILKIKKTIKDLNEKIDINKAFL